MAARKSNLWGRLGTTTRSGAATTELDGKRQELLAHWAAHPWNWLTGKDIDGKPIIWTKDEKDGNNPLKPFPEHLEYLRWYVELLWNPDGKLTLPDGRVLETTRFLDVDKCRQMYISTATIAVMDWWCRFRPYRRFLVSKQKEEQAGELINDKARQIHKELPAWVQLATPQDETPYQKINYPQNSVGGGDSYILGVAQNAAESEARGGTATAVLIDEACFQDATDEIIDGARPMAGRIWVVSSPYLGTRGGVTVKKILDYGTKPGHPKVEEHRLQQGLHLSVTPLPHGWTRLKIDHDADPSHTPEWLKQAEGGYTDRRKFEREILRLWSSAAGQPFYPEWARTGGRETHERVATGLIPGQPVVRGWDFGRRNPACMWMQYDPARRRLWYLRELSLQGLGTHTFRDLVLYYSGQLGEEELPMHVRQWVRELQQDPRYQTPFFSPMPSRPLTFLDWSGHEALQERAEVADDSDERTSAQILASRGVILEIQYGAVRSGHELLRELMPLRPDGWPGVLVDPACSLWLEALDGGLTYKKGTEANPAPEEVRKDEVFSHAHEAALYPVPSLVPLKGHEVQAPQIVDIRSIAQAAALPTEEELDFGFTLQGRR